MCDLRKMFCNIVKYYLDKGKDINEAIRIAKSVVMKHYLKNGGDISFLEMKKSGLMLFIYMYADR